VSAPPEPGLEGLLEFLKRARGFDFTGYKRPTLERRFSRRMQAVGCGSHGDYLDYLEVHPDEFEALFDALLINVTSFFRDAPAWAQLQHETLPALLAEKAPDEPIRVWSAGCASGEEAYTAAMVLAEVLGIDAYLARVKVYGTDIDEDALSTARHGTFAAKQVETVPPDLRERYFDRSDRRHAVRRDIRRTVIFGRNNLLGDAPISRIDVLLCRNTLMYFTAERQSGILRHFHYALRDHGVLMLGRSEMMLTHRDAFQALDLPQRIFRKTGGPVSLPARVARLPDGEQVDVPLSADERLSRDAALDTSPNPQVIVSRAGLVTFANLTARTLFGIGVEDFGRPFQDVELSYQPVELRIPVEDAIRERRRVVVGEVDHRPQKGEERRLDVSVTPLLEDGGGAAVAASIVFEDITRYAAVERELLGNRRDLELAYEELQSTIDELETTNEELQSANEELQTTNEELQSTNEELETMNEELQSTNEELEAMNDELRERTGDVNRVNDFLEAILGSVGLGVAVLDAEQRVQVWNRQAEDLWGLRPDEATDHHFLALDIGLPTERLAPALRGVLKGGSEGEQVTLDAVNRRGRPVTVHTTLTPLLGGDGSGPVVQGAIVIMEAIAASGDEAA
jgi:two-component system CheB/CheR fusion protein